MAVQTEVVYPSTPAFSGAAQLNLGPFNVPFVNRLLRAEVHGKLNFQGEVISSSGVEANAQLWALQWVTAGAGAADVVTTADGPNWLLRQQIGSEETRMAWAPNTSNAAVLITVPTKGKWAGQLAINASIDLWLSMRAPTGAVIPNFNYFGSIRWWWS